MRKSAESMGQKNANFQIYLLDLLVSSYKSLFYINSDEARKRTDGKILFPFDVC